MKQLEVFLFNGMMEGFIFLKYPRTIIGKNYIVALYIFDAR